MILAGDMTRRKGWMMVDFAIGKGQEGLENVFMKVEWLYKEEEWGYAIMAMWRRLCFNVAVLLGLWSDAVAVLLKGGGGTVIAH